MELRQKYRLGEVFNVLDSKRIPLSSKERESRRGNYPYYGAQGIIDYIDDYIFDGEYLLIAEDGENLKSQKQNIAQIARGKYWVNNHAHILESNGKCDIRYICHLLNKMDISGYITGSAQPKLNQANLCSIEVELPDIQEQKRIAEFIGNFDDKIELNRQINDNLEQQAQALYKSWFVDFEPFKDGDFIDSEMGSIPRGWKIGKIKDIIDLLSGFPFKSSDFTKNGEYQLITIKGVQDGYLDVTSADRLSYLPSKMPHYCILKIGDILISLTGNVGRICIVDRKDLLLNQRVAIVSPKNKRDSFYAYTMFRNDSFKNELIHLARGTAQLNLSPVETADKLTIIPPDIILEDFAKIGQDIFKQYVSTKMENIRLCEMRDSLLPKLMSGELKINEIDR